MIGEKPHAPKTAAVTTRREMIATNVKAIGGILASALVASLSTRAQANEGHEHHGHAFGHGNGGQCFLKGTRIRTVHGERNVEDLAIGDLLPTVFGGERPVKWIAQYRRTKVDRGQPWAKRVQPIRIMKSALSPDIPHADLIVTPGHALLIDGILVTATMLVNETTIAPYAAAEHDELMFFQVKLETHDVIYAEGAPCETLLRVNETASNFADYVGAYGTDAPDEVPCAPIIGNGYRSELKLRARSIVSPWLGPQKIDIIRDRLGAQAVALAD